MNRKSNSGSTLVLTMFVIGILAIFVAVTLKFSQSTGQSAHHLGTIASAEAVGTGCLELAFSSWRQICRNIRPTNLVNGVAIDSTTGIKLTYYSPPATDAFANLVLPTTGMFPDVTGFSATRGPRQGNEIVSNYRVQGVDPLITLASSTVLGGPVSALGANAAVSFSSTTFDALGLFSPKSYYYLASVDVTLLSPRGPITTRLREVFEKRLASPFQFALFFMEDLELHPTAPLTVFGAVHTNGNLYTGTEHLTFNSDVPALLNTSTGAKVQGPEAVQKYPGVSYGEQWQVGFKPGDAFHAGVPQRPIVASALPRRGSKLEPYDIDPTSWNATDANPNNDGLHELIETAVAPGAHPDPLGEKLHSPVAGAHAANPGEAAYGWNNLHNITRRLRDACAIQIECDSNTGTVTIKRRDGVILTGNSLQYGPATAPALVPPEVDAYALQNVYKLYQPNPSAGPGEGGAISMGATIQDAREGGAVKLITIDGSKIWDWNHTRSHGPFLSWLAPDGILYAASSYLRQVLDPSSLIGSDSVYITDTSANWAGGNRVAIRLKNFGRTALQTIVTDLPVYIQGDVNTGTITAATRQATNDLAWASGLLPAYPEPPVNNATVPGTNYNNLNMPNDLGTTSAPGRPPVSNYTRVPCVVVSDAVTVLSNNWDDARSGLGVGSRPASNTTVNCNIVSGNVPTSGGYYSGGAENFLRLLEDWNGRRLTVVGSQVQMWPSKHAIGTWGKPNVYAEPAQRLWYPEPLMQGVPGSRSIVAKLFMDDAPELLLVSYRRHRWYKE